MLTLKTREDLQKLIEEKLPESLTLDYKASPALSKSSDGRSELIKDVTAFANSAGGQIVYGIVEKNGVPQRLDDGTDSGEITPEWIEQVVDTNSAPRIQGMKVTTIVADSIESKRVYYVVAVPAATSFAPHQNAIDKKYYRRFELRSVPMHDYEIRDLLRRGQTPELTARITFADGSLSRTHSSAAELIEFETIMENLSAEPSLYSLFSFYFDDRLSLVNDAGYKRLKPLDLESFSLHQLQKVLMVPNEFPLLKGTHITVGPPRITLRIPEKYFGKSESFLIGYAANASGFRVVKFAGLSIDKGKMAISDFVDLNTVDLPHS